MSSTTAPVGLGVRVRVVADETGGHYVGFTGTVCHLAPCDAYPIHIRFDAGQTDWPGSRFWPWEVEVLSCS